MPERRPTTVEIAADWVAAVDGGLTPAQRRELEAWLAADLSHRAAFQRLDGQYKADDRLSEFKPAVPDEVSPQLLGDGPILSFPDFDPNRSARRRRPIRWGRIVLGVICAAAAVLTYFFWWRPSYGSIHEIDTTSVVEIRKVILPDGSQIVMSDDTAVEVFYTRGQRRVQLSRGEAAFAVAKDNPRPFVVEAGNIAVLAAGTAFSIRVSALQIEVVVTEGLVHVRDANSGHTVLGDQAVYQSRDFEEPVLAAGERTMVRRSVP
jgi:transmembrane sensor